jgi:hypothetical protein
VQTYKPGKLVSKSTMAVNITSEINIQVIKPNLLVHSNDKFELNIRKQFLRMGGITNSIFLQPRGRSHLGNRLLDITSEISKQPSPPRTLVGNCLIITSIQKRSKVLYLNFQVTAAIIMEINFQSN